MDHGHHSLVLRPSTHVSRKIKVYLYYRVLWHKQLEINSFGFFIALRSPNCSENALKIDTTNVEVHLEKCSFQIGTDYVQVLYKNRPSEFLSLDKTFNLTGLQPGQLTIFSILACGQMGIHSFLTFSVNTGKICFPTWPLMLLVNIHSVFGLFRPSSFHISSHIRRCIGKGILCNSMALYLLVKTH